MGRQEGMRNWESNEEGGKKGKERRERNERGGRMGRGEGVRVRRKQGT
jgi:hypothetical protein